MQILYRTNGIIIDSSNELSIKELVIKNKHNLLDADLKKADLREINLQGGDLREANLSFADLREADLWNIDFQDANLREADLRKALLEDVNFQGTDLREANLQDANLKGTYLKETDLRGAKYDYKKLMFQVDWDELSEGLTLELMRQDADLSGKLSFRYKRLWKPGKPKYGKDQMWDLFKALCEEKGVKIK